MLTENTKSIYKSINYTQSLKRFLFQQCLEHVFLPAADITKDYVLTVLKSYMTEQRYSDVILTKRAVMSDIEFEDLFRMIKQSLENKGNNGLYILLLRFEDIWDERDYQVYNNVIKLLLSKRNDIESLDIEKILYEEQNKNALEEVCDVYNDDTNANFECFEDAESTLNEVIQWSNLYAEINHRNLKTIRESRIINELSNSYGVFKCFLEELLGLNEIRHISLVRRQVNKLLTHLNILISIHNDNIDDCIFENEEGLALIQLLENGTDDIDTFEKALSYVSGMYELLRYFSITMEVNFKV